MVILIFKVSPFEYKLLRFSYNNIFTLTPCHFSALAEILGSIELLENSLTFEGVQWRKIIVLMPSQAM